MGRAVLRWGGKSTPLLLSSTTLVGRHWSCHVPVDEASLPLYWVEIRWQDGSWTWRALAAEDRTAGTGASMTGGWRRWGQGRATLRLAQTLSIHLTDASPPEVLLEDVATGQRRAGAQIDELVEVSESGVRPLGSDDGPWSGDGDVLALGGIGWRIWWPTDWHTQHEVSLNLTEPGLMLEINPEAVTAVLTQGQHTVRVEGSLARLVWTYANARVEQDPAAGGWLDKKDAFEAWREAGGAEQSTPSRVAWERGKLRSYLTRRGVYRPELFFERKQVAGRWLHRLLIAPGEIQQVED